MHTRVLAYSVVCALVLASTSPASAQITRIERDRALIMLDVVRDDIAKYYFDSTFGGVDLKSAFDTARARVRTAERIEQILGAIAVAALSLGDSHTAFVPPGLIYRAEYGWLARFIGDTCRIIEVKKSSDAEAKGVRPGDALLAVNGFPLNRRNLWQLEYSINLLQPRSSLRLTLSSPGAAGEPRDLDVQAKVTQRTRVLDLNSSIDLSDLIREQERLKDEQAIIYRSVDRVVLWKMNTFAPDLAWIDELMKRVRDRDALVMDLRGNGGGSIAALRRLIGQLHPDRVLIATELTRKGPVPMLSDPVGKARFAGKVILLVDAGSASSSELLAKTLQLTGRGIVLGDRTAGAVRTSRVHGHAVGTQTAAFYGASVTESDLLMPDGDRLENNGVTPDELVLPSGADLLAGDDPALARALTLAGVPTSPRDAGKLFARR